MVDKSRLYYQPDGLDLLFHRLQTHMQMKGHNFLRSQAQVYWFTKEGFQSLKEQYAGQECLCDPQMRICLSNYTAQHELDVALASDMHNLPNLVNSVVLKDKDQAYTMSASYMELRVLMQVLLEPAYHL